MEALQPDINSLQSIVEERVDVEPPKKIAVARPLPPYWPTLSLPRAPSPTFLGDIAPALVMHAASEEEKGWHAIVKPEPSAAATPPSKRAQHGKKALKKREEWETANLVGKKCKCGKEDVEKFMLQCDDCDVWHHGECVGVSQVQASRLRSWRCRTCARRHETKQARTLLYCECRGPWNGRSFMIACDGARRASPSMPIGRHWAPACCLRTRVRLIERTRPRRCSPYVFCMHHLSTNLTLDLCAALDRL